MKDTLPYFDQLFLGNLGMKVFSLVIFHALRAEQIQSAKANSRKHVALCPPDLRGKRMRQIVCQFYAALI